MFEKVGSFFVAYGVYIGIASFVLLLLSVVATIVIIAKLPQDYWRAKFKPRRMGLRHGLTLIVRNILAAVLFLIGVILIFTPGQGLLTILIAVLLSDFPYKHKMIENIISRDGVRSGLNKVRRFMGKEEFVFD